MLTVAFTAENVVKEIGDIPWQMLIAALAIDRCVEVQIGKISSNNNVLVEKVLKHWFQHFETSWEALALAVMSIQPFKDTGAYIYNKYVNPKCKNMFLFLVTFTMVNRIGFLRFHS